MKTIILISGRQDSGKTNTIGLLYEALVKIHSAHTFNGKNAESSQIKFPIKRGGDFLAIFDLKNNQRLGLISGGDDLDMFKEDSDSIKDKIDVLICASRQQMRDNSVHEYIVNEMPKNGFQLKLNLCTFDTKDIAEMSEMQRNILNVILNFLKL